MKFEFDMKGMKIYMMNGIEVLSQVTVGFTDAGDVFAAIIASALFVRFLVIMICLIKDRDIKILGGIVLGLVVVFCGVMTVGTWYDCFNPITYTEYKVTISDEVKLSEFNERYEIIKQEGKIYTIKVKNQGKSE
jgi:hypothetical protein